MDIFKEINSKVKKATFSPRILISRLRFLDEQSKYSFACLDPHYLPFYYYLGKTYPVESLLEIGFGLGINAACYLRGSPDTKEYLTFQQTPNEYYNSRMGIANIKQVWQKPFYAHVGQIHDEGFVNRIGVRKWDMAMISDKMDYDTHMSWLNLVWENMKENGHIFMDFLNSHEQARRAYKDFCIIKNRKEFLFETRYQVGVIER